MGNFAIDPSIITGMTKRHTCKTNSERCERSKRNLLKTRNFVDEIFSQDLHAKRVESLANAVTGVMRAACLSIHTIGIAYAAFAEIQPKNGVKQVDRFLSNKGLNVHILTPSWVRFVLGSRTEAVLALDWTDYENDDHTTLAGYVVTSHGRATPLAWQTVKKSSLKERQKRYEHEFIERLSKAISSDVRITLLADRGFGDRILYRHLESIGWDYVIRFRGNIYVEDENGEVRPAAKWVAANGRAKILPNARVTAEREQVGAVVVVHAKKMKEPWCLASNLSKRKASEIVKLYGKRFTIEETFRDQKDLRFGMGLRATHIRSAERRDRLLLLAALAQALLTLLGAASEATGLDRILKANTVKTRTHSLFRQGLYWYSAIPFTRDEWITPLLQAFDKIVSEHAVFNEVFDVI